MLNVSAVIQWWQSISCIMSEVWDSGLKTRVQKSTETCKCSTKWELWRWSWYLSDEVLSQGSALIYYASFNLPETGNYVATKLLFVGNHYGNWLTHLLFKKMTTCSSFAVHHAKKPWKILYECKPVILKSGEKCKIPILFLSICT